MMMMTWKDEMGNRSRKAWLLLVAKGEIIPFAGESIPGVVAVVGRDYTKNGKWSHHTYRLMPGDGVDAVAGHNGWDSNTFAEGLVQARRAAPGAADTWEGVAGLLGVTREAAERFLRAWRPKAAERLDETKAAIAAVE